jgi:hypothetical protein
MEGTAKSLIITFFDQILNYMPTKKRECVQIEGSNPSTKNYIDAIAEYLLKTTRSHLYY